MTDIPDTVKAKLASISEQITKGVAPTTETVRTMLLWFQATRRGPRIVRQIQETLAAYGLRTQPDFEYAFIDDDIRFVPRDAQDAAAPAGIATTDPTYRIVRLESANRAPMCVAPDSPLERAVTLMLAHDYSQLPVMTGPRELKGVVSWKTIGSRLALGLECPHVRDCMEPAHVIGTDDSLFDAVSKIALNDYVLVLSPDKRISGIVTASDFNQQFHNLAEPFLLIGEIENGVRQMLHGKFTADELTTAKAPGDDGRSIASINDLTFGEYQRLLESPDMWTRVGLRIDRVEFVERLKSVRDIRNDVMHFEPEGLDAGDLSLLREFAQFLKRLRDVKAV
jgi:CBS domain-containing protein